MSETTWRLSSGLLGHLPGWPEPADPEQEERLWRRSQRATEREKLEEFGRLIEHNSLGCPRRPISCGHSLGQHCGPDTKYDLLGGLYRDKSCQVPGCDCDGKN